MPHQFYSMKWFMLLMCQEFNITDSLRLWDTLLAAEDDLPGKSKVSRFSFINYVAVALVRQKSVRETIIKENDFATCME